MTDKKNRITKGVKMITVGRFFLALTIKKCEVNIPIDIPINNETNNMIQKFMI